MQYLRLTLDLLSAFVCTATALPFIKTDRWWIRVFDFPRLQVAVLGIAVMIAYSLVFRENTRIEWALVVLLSVALVVQVWHIVLYTPFTGKQVKKATHEENAVSVLVANVLQENRNTSGLLEQIKKHDPDLILLNEMDAWWTEQMKCLEETHPHKVLCPMSNTYGMNLYSRCELNHPEVRFLIDERIPSIRTAVTLLNGRRITFYGVHPRPPALKRPGNDEREDSAFRDAELVVVAKEVAKLKGPIIVAGDFNDVAWSHTTRLFQRISRLLDPRVGRGLFNSYNAKTPFFRYPLDHLFHSDHFTLVKLERLDYFGSDHFPIFAVLNLEPEAAHEQEAPPEKPDDREEAQEILRRPIEKKLSQESAEKT